MTSASHLRETIDGKRAARPLASMERRGSSGLMESLRGLAREAVRAEILRPLPDGAVARILINTGSLAAILSYSALTNEFHGAAERPPAPVVIAFPGEGDERTLSLLNLRPDANYRVPRI